MNDKFALFVGTVVGAMAGFWILNWLYNCVADTTSGAREGIREASQDNPMFWVALVVVPTILGVSAWWFRRR